MGKRTDKYKIKEEKKKKSKNISKFVLNAMFYAICITLVVGAIMFVTSKDEKKSLFGLRTYIVQTNSMKPGPNRPSGGFIAGDMIFVKLCDPETIKIGDIITFVPGKDSTTYLTHRVVNILTEFEGQQGLYFVTRGDANNADDPPFSSEMLIGKKFFSIPKLGKLIKFVSKNLIISAIVVLVIFSLISVLRLYLGRHKKTNNTLI